MKADCENEEPNFSDICRACALSFNPTVLKDITPPIRDTLLFCAGIQIDLMTELPTQICGTCLVRADSAASFKMQCQLAEEKLVNLAKNKKADASTPCHREENYIDKSPKTLFDLPFSPLRCDSALNQIFHQNGDSIPNLDNSSLSNQLNAILDDNNDDNQVVQDDNININEEEQSIDPNTVLSFLDHTEGKVDNEILDDSFSLNFGSPAKTEDELLKDVQENEAIDVDTFFLPVEKETDLNDEVKEAESKEPINHNFHKIHYVNGKFINVSNDMVILNSIGVNEKERVNSEVVKSDISYNEQIEAAKVVEIILNGVTQCKVKVRDFVKFALPYTDLQSELNDLGYVRCRFCYISVNNIETLKNHSIAEHLKQMSECKESADYVKLCFPEKEIKPKEGKELQCPLCNTMFRNNIAASLYRHLRKRHLDETKRAFLIKSCPTAVYICDYCNKEYTDRKMFTKHIWVHVRKPRRVVGKLNCDICKIVFKAEKSLKTHLQSHKIKVYGEKKPSVAKKSDNICEICGKLFSTKANLKCHLKRHNPDFASQCAVCDKMFKTKRDVDHHMKIHFKNYECGFCQKKFARSDLLTTHIRVHTDERLYKCSECDESFSVNVLLKRHYKAKHGREDTLARLHSRDDDKI